MVSRRPDPARIAAVEAGKPARGFDHVCDTPGCECRARVAEVILDLDTPWRGSGETHDWCQGCDRTPNRRLMAWTSAGWYLCRSCRTIIGQPEQPSPAVAELINGVVVAAGTPAAYIPLIAPAPAPTPELER